MVCFVAYGEKLRIPGEYEKSPFSGDVRKFFHERGGFWSLVHGQHEILICMEVLKTTVTNMDWPLNKDSKNPGCPSVGDELLVVIPDESFTQWADESIDDWGREEKIPIPKCRVEMWKRVR